MKKTFIVFASCLAASGLYAQTTYYGNGDSSWNGAIGNGSLTLNNDATTLYGSLTTGGGLGGNAFVLYLQAGSGGIFSSTSGFNDDQDQLRSALSEYSSSGQSILDFGSSFAPNYGISLQPGSGINYGGLWQLSNGGAGSQIFVSSINLAPTGSDVAGTYTFSVNLSDLGLSAGQSLELFGLQVSTSGYSSPEALGGTMTGTSGWGNTQTVASYSTYTVVAVPEPTTLALAGMGGLAMLFAIRRRK